MSNKTRIPTNPAAFNAYMNITDDLQLTVITPPSTLRYTLFGWTQEESEKWTAFRTNSNTVFAEYIDDDKVGPAVRKKIKKLIKDTRAYDNDKENGHHLLDRVALNGTVDDCITFHVKRSTSLEADPVHHADDPTNLQPTLDFKEYGIGRHVIMVSHPDYPNTKKLPDGMKFAKIFRFIGVAPPAQFSQYELLGNAKRGLFVSTFSEVFIEGQQKIYAYYFGRYESQNGMLGNPGTVLRGELLQGNYLNNS